MKTYIKNIDGHWYAFAADETKNQVHSIGADSPRNGTWCSRWTDSGIRYVATRSPSRSAAYQKAKRYGEYAGEIK